jgi:hypothetical protein
MKIQRLYLTIHIDCINYPQNYGIQSSTQNRCSFSVMKRYGTGRRQYGIVLTRGLINISGFTAKKLNCDKDNKNVYVNILQTGMPHQTKLHGCTNFQNIWDSPQSSGCQAGDLKQSPCYGTTYILSPLLAKVTWHLGFVYSCIVLSSDENSHAVGWGGCM